jgi:hypothetical protein
VITNLEDKEIKTTTSCEDMGTSNQTFVETNSRLFKSRPEYFRIDSIIIFDSCL